MAFKIFNYPFRHVVTEGEFNTAFYYAYKQTQFAKRAFIFDGFAISSSGLNYTITRGQAKGDNVTLGFLDSNQVLDNWSPFVELDADTTYTYPASTTKYLVAQCVINSTAAFQDSYTTITDIKLVDSLMTAFPTGNIIGEVCLGQLISDATSIVIDLTDRASDIGSLTSINALVARVKDVEDKRIQYIGVYNPTTNTPNLSTATATSLQNKMYSVSAYSATANIGGNVQEVFENDVIVSNGSTIKVINSGKIWSD